MSTSPVLTQNLPTAALPKPKLTRLHGLALSIVLGLLFRFLPTGLPHKRQLALGISIFTVARWACKVLAIEMTAMRYSVLIAVFGILSPPRAFAGFADVTPWFMVALRHFPLMEAKTAVGGMVPAVAGYVHAMAVPFMAPTLICTIAGVSIAFVPFKVLPAVLMIGFGRTFLMGTAPSPSACTAQSSLSCSWSTALPGIAARA